MRCVWVEDRQLGDREGEREIAWKGGKGDTRAGRQERKMESGNTANV